MLKKVGGARHLLLISNLIIISAILLGFVGMVYKDTKSYQDLAEKHLESTVKLADIDISKHIENSMSKPVMVSKTMANDEFLKSWLVNEPQVGAGDTERDQLYSYLRAYQQKYDYDTVFCVSAKTGNYYYQDGFNKTISPKDEHDVWYYNFVSSNNEYDLEVDTNQSSGDTITVFVNFRVEGKDGLLGIIGVGLQVSFIEDTIREYERDYDLSVYIINEGGAKTSFTGDTDIFIDRVELAQRTGVDDEIELDRSTDANMQWFTSGTERKCLITKYDNTLGWYLILEKQTDSINSAFGQRLVSNLLFMALSLAVCILVTTLVFHNYNQRMVTVENTDELTGLANRRLFAKQYASFMHRHRQQPKTLFLFDIDHFKQINDSYGHVFGNAILAMVASELRDAIAENGIASRWGGDEFFGVLALPPQQAEELFATLMQRLNSEEKDSRYRVTISVGLAEVSSKLNVEQITKKADKALYCSKQNGRNQITHCEAM